MVNECLSFHLVWFLYSWYFSCIYYHASPRPRLVVVGLFLQNTNKTFYYGCKCNEYALNNSRGTIKFLCTQLVNSRDMKIMLRLVTKEFCVWLGEGGLKAYLHASFSKQKSTFTRIGHTAVVGLKDIKTMHVSTPYWKHVAFWNKDEGRQSNEQVCLYG